MVAKLPSRDLHPCSGLDLTHDHFKAQIQKFHIAKNSFLQCLERPNDSLGSSFSQTYNRGMEFPSLKGCETSIKIIEIRTWKVIQINSLYLNSLFPSLLSWFLKHPMLSFLPVFLATPSQSALQAALSSI